MVRWFILKIAKDIGTLYIIFSIFAGMVGTAFSMLIRLELSITDMLLNLNSLYNFKLFPIVECIADNYISNTKNVDTTDLNINVKTDGFTVLGEGLKVAGNALNRIHPALTGAAVGYGAAKILKTLPPAGRVGAVGAVTTIVSGTALLSQMINANLADSSTKIVETSTKSNNELENLFINNPLEYANLYDGLILVIIIYAIGGLYALITLSISFLVKEFKFESSSFVVARPWLAKYLTFVGVSNRITIFILLALIGLTFMLILFVAIYLRTHLPPNL